MAMPKLAFAALVAASVGAPFAASFAAPAASPSAITNATIESMTQQAIMSSGDVPNAAQAPTTVAHAMHRNHLDIDDMGRDRSW